MSKVRNSNKKVTLSELNNHTISNKRQALKDLKMLNFDDIQFKTPAQRRFYNTISTSVIGNYRISYKYVILYNSI